MIPRVLTIAGSDPSGGAGIQADLKTFSALKCYGMAAITALTAQNTMGVKGLHEVDPEFLELQLRAIFDDVPPDALKIGMVGDVESIEVIVKILEEYKPPNVVVDPVMISTSGDALIDRPAMDALKTKLIPLADIITPNKEEAFNLGCESSRDLSKLGAKAALLTGGNRKDANCIDILATDSGAKAFEKRRFDTKNTHGTGCTLSAAIAAYMARGLPVQKAVGAAKVYITECIRHADALEAAGEKPWGGAGPVHHFWKLWAEPEEERQEDE